jgi:hypothetical protein
MEMEEAARLSPVLACSLGCLALAGCCVCTNGRLLCLHRKKFAPDATSSDALSPLPYASATFFWPKVCLHFAYYKMRPLLLFNMHKTHLHTNNDH